MTDADVEGLLADLAAGDRAAELALIEGTWDWLRDVPDAAAVHPWLDAAGIARLPREQRREALTTRRLAPATWAVAIGRPALPRDLALVTSWLRRQGIDAGLAVVIRRAILAMRDAHGTCDAGYDELLDALLHAEYDGAHFPDEELALLVLDYAAVRERIETARMHLDDAENTTLAPLVADLDAWGPAVAPQLADCLLDATDTAAVQRAASAAGGWTTPGVRAALRRRFALGRSPGVAAAVAAAEAPHEAIAEGARLFLAEDVKASSLQRVRSTWERSERDRLDAALRAPRADRRRGLGRGARRRATPRRSVD